MDHHEALSLGANLVSAKEWIGHLAPETEAPIFIDPENTFVDRRAVIGAQSIIFPFVVLIGPCVIGKRCVIFPHTTLLNVIVGDDVTLGLPHQKNSNIGDGCVIGSCAEFNRMNMGGGSKMAHNSYLGDTELGRDCNVGAGFVTANYDGEHKHKTSFGSGSFLGVNSTVIAPNDFPEGTQIAAGSTIPQNIKNARLIPPFSVLISRAKELFIKPRKMTNKK